LGDQRRIHDSFVVVFPRAGEIRDRRSVTDNDRRECATDLLAARIAESWVGIVQTKYVGFIDCGSPGDVPAR
jgi:hypothetical protein